VPVAALPPLTAANAPTAWTFAPAVAVAVVVLAAAYLWGVRRVKRWPLARTLFFLVAGLGSWALMSMSFIGTYDTTLFWPRAVQTVILLMVTPLFLALGMPLRLLMRALPETAARRVRDFGRGRFARAITFPAVISILLLSTPFALFFTPWFDAMLRGGVADTLTSFWLVGVGWAYYWTRLQVDPVPATYPALVSMWITFAEVIFDGGLGLFLMLSSHVIGLSHFAAVRDWGPTPLTDQQMGGASFWLLGDLSGLPFLGALFRKMISDDERKSAEVDRELDALAAQARLARRRHTTESLAGTPAQPEPPDDGMERPWWETDPSRLRR
jgi:cytochrome c oxidase assembly factor CtaG